MPDVESLDHLGDRIALFTLGAEPQVPNLAPNRLLAPVQLSRDHLDTEMLHGFKEEPHVGVSPGRRRGGMTRVQAEFSRPSHNRLPRESCQPLNFGDGRLDGANLLRTGELRS